jgi:DNA-binding NtrC family response regulator
MEGEMAKILIVGKNNSAREVMAEELANEGYVVVMIGNPALIEELLATLEPDVVLLDLHIDAMDRWNVSMEIKKQAPPLPILTFASYGDAKGEINLIQENGYEIKSFSLEILKQKVAELLKLKPTQSLGGMRDDFLPAWAESPSMEAKNQTGHWKKFRPFHP